MDEDNQIAHHREVEIPELGSAELRAEFPQIAVQVFGVLAGQRVPALDQELEVGKKLGLLFVR